MPRQRHFGYLSSTSAARRAPGAGEDIPRACTDVGAAPQPQEASRIRARVIPLNNGLNPPAPGTAGRSMRSRRRHRSTRRRVLLVDDNRDHVLSLAALLQALGHAVRAEYDGGAVLDAAAEFRPQVVILDIGLPVMDGYEVARRLRALYPEGSLLLIALTGYGQARDNLQAKAAGFDSFMVKPPDLRALSALLDADTRVASSSRGEAITIRRNTKP